MYRKKCAVCFLVYAQAQAWKSAADAAPGPRGEQIESFQKVVNGRVELIYNRHILVDTEETNQSSAVLDVISRGQEISVLVAPVPAKHWMKLIKVGWDVGGVAGRMAGGSTVRVISV